MNTCGDLIDIYTGEAIRPATLAEMIESIQAAEWDGTVGAITVDGRTCYVSGEEVAHV